MLSRSAQSPSHRLHLSAQGTFLIGRRRLVNRRIDWLLHLLTTAVSNEYALRLQRQGEVMELNMRQHAAMNAALLKAKGEDDDKVTMENEHTASVQSRSDEQIYTVSLPQDASTRDAHLHMSGRRAWQDVLACRQSPPAAGQL